MSNRPNRFLIVDRIEESSRLFSRIGRRLGYSTDTAESLDEFVDALANDTPTVVLIDLQSVVDEGLAHLKALRNSGCDAQLILTSDSNVRALETAKQLAAFLGLRVVACLRTSLIVNLVRNELRKARQSRTDITTGDLRTAIESGHVLPCYQPLVSSRSGCGWPITAVEVTPCWEIEAPHAALPEDILSLAEDTGLAHELTTSLLERTVAQMRAWHARRINLCVTMKLPAIVLSDRALPEFLYGLVKDANLEASSLTLEISEALAMGYSTAAYDVLDRLKSFGFRLAISEFGTSYSSLEQLYRLKFDELKVDPSLVLESRISGDARKILEATVLLAKKFGMEVCADGVDSQRTLHYLGRIGCNTAQGSYISRPLGPTPLATRMIEWNAVPAIAS